MAFLALKLKTTQLSRAFPDNLAGQNCSGTHRSGKARRGCGGPLCPSYLFQTIQPSPLSSLCPSEVIRVHCMLPTSCGFLYPSPDHFNSFTRGSSFLSPPYPLSLSLLPLSPTSCFTTFLPFLPHVESTLHYDYRPLANPLTKLAPLFHHMNLAEFQPS